MSFRERGLGIHRMTRQQHSVLAVAAIVAAAAALGTVVVSTVGAATARYSLKVRVTEKNTTDNFFVGHVLDQTSGKTNIEGDVLVFRALSTATYYDKNNKKNSRKSWMSNVKASSTEGDTVTVVGLYKSADKTFEITGKAVNRSR